jgi:hypothetical protein
MGKGGCGKEGCRTILWMAWVANMVRPTIPGRIAAAAAVGSGEAAGAAELLPIRPVRVPPGAQAAPRAGAAHACRPVAAR